jgi:multidrug efflux pump subunit AcrA (membrane-fusion protein)
VTVNIEATGARIETADIRAVPSVDSKARTFPVVVRLDNSTGTLAPGMSVTAWVPTGDLAERLTIHKDAVMRGPTGAYAYAARTTDPKSPLAMRMCSHVLCPSIRDSVAALAAETW